MKHETFNHMMTGLNPADGNKCPICGESLTTHTQCSCEEHLYCPKCFWNAGIPKELIKR